MRATLFLNTVASKLRTWGVPISIVIGSILIAAAYVLPNITTKEIATAVSPSFAEANSNDDLLKSLAGKDSDGDGLPDWEEALYGTDPNKVISNKFNIPDGEAVKQGLLTPQSQIATSTDASDIPQPAPATDSLTDAFAKTFFQQYMAASGGQTLDPASEQTLLTQLVTQFVANAPAITSSYATSSVAVSAGETPLEYAGAVEAVLTADDAGISVKDSDLIALLEDGTINDDTDSLQKLKTLSVTYRKFSTDLSALTAPPSLLGAHLMLVRSFDELSLATALTAKLNDDPLAALTSIAVYSSAPEDFVHAASTISDEVESTAGVPKKGAPGYLLYTVEQAGK